MRTTGGCSCCGRTVTEQPEPMRSSGWNRLPAFHRQRGATELRPEDSMKDLLKRADEALYRAKDNGRNRVENG
nr:diguanylate cyclase [Pseudodesulfovibrio sediminis]